MRSSPARKVALVGVVLVLLLSTAFAVLRLEFEGPALGDKLAASLNKRMRGRIAIGSIEWDSASLKTAVTGGWVPVTIRDVRVWDDCALNTGAPATDEIRQGDPNEDCTSDDQPDPDPSSKRKPRKLLLKTDLITGEIDIHALLSGNHDIVARNIWVHGGEALLEQTREPYPLHAYDRTIVSIITAFYPRQKPGFRAGTYADQPPAIFDLRDFHIANVNLTVHMNPYSGSGEKTGFGTTARFEGVDVDAGPEPRNDSYLYMDSVDPLVAKFYVRIVANARRGRVALWDEGLRDSFRIPTSPTEQYPPKGRSADYEIALTDVALHRLAQLPNDWARNDFVANTLELDLEAKAVPCPTEAEPVPDRIAGAAPLHVTGELFNYWDRPYDGSWNLKLDGKNLGPTIRSCIKSKVGGDNLDGTITLTGPFVASPKITLAMKNLDFDVPLRADEPPLRLTLSEVQGSIDLVNEQGSLDKTTALIASGTEPGEVELSATFGLKPYNARAHVEIVKAIDVGRFLPETAKPVGTFLQGRLTAVGDSDIGFSLEDFDLALGATAKEKAVRAHGGRLFTNDDFDTVKIQQVHVEAGKSRAVVDGWVDIVKDTMDVSIDGNFPDLAVWLRRFGVPGYVQSAGAGVVRIKGPIANPTVNVAAELGGVPCLDRVRIVDSEYNSDTGVLDIRALTSEGLGGQLKGSARLVIGDRTKGKPTVIERLQIQGRRLEAARLCGQQHVKGTIDVVDLELANGTVDPSRTMADWLALTKLRAQAASIAILGDKYTNLAMCVNRKDDASCRPRTTYLDGDDLQQCEQGKRNGFCAVATATRDRGGVVDATIASSPAITGGRRLGGTIAMADLPIDVINQLTLRKEPIAKVGGTASVTLHLQGTPDAPQAEGAIQLLRTWVEGTFFGDVQLAVRPVATAVGGKPGIAISGAALAGRFGLAGTLATQMAGTFPVELALSGRRLELDVFADLQKRFDLPMPVQLWTTGKVTVKTELAPPPTRPAAPEAWVELDELVGTITPRSADGRITPLTLRAVDQDPGKRPAVSIHVTPSSIDFACRSATSSGRVDCTTRLALGAQSQVRPAGVIDLKGHVAPHHIAIEAFGKVDLAPIAPLVENTFAALSGTADLKASIQGSFTKPSYEASLELKDLQARPLNGGDTILDAPSGLIKLSNGTLGFTNVMVRVRDPNRDAAGTGTKTRAPRDEAGELNIKGTIDLAGLQPTRWALLVDGQVAGKMLMVLPALIPGLEAVQVSQASGLARIEGNLELTGRGPRPTVTGTLVFDRPPPCPRGTKDADPNACVMPGEPTRALTVMPRGMRGREFAFTEGSIDIATETVNDRRTYRVDVNDVSATIDGNGTISDIDGYAEVRDGVIGRLGLRLDAENVPYRKPGTLDLLVSASGISVTKMNETAPLDVRGSVTIVDGKYTQDFELAEGLRSLGTTAPPSTPVWDVYPILGNANLDLEIEVRKFRVQSNIASIDLAGDIVLNETPRDPRLSGQIRVERGRFRLPGMRAAFTDTSGQINFNKDQPADNPELRIVSDADYRDLTGQDHVVTLTIEGYIRALTWDLKTSTGYNKSQTMSLLLLGRNPEQLRRSLGDQSLGSDPTQVDPTTNPSQGFADQIVKDLAGDWVSDLLENSLTKITGLDVLRIEVGFGSIGFHVEKRLLENVTMIGTSEQTIRGNTVNGRFEVKRTSRLSFQGGYLRKNFNDPAEEDISDWNAKLIYRRIWK